MAIGSLGITNMVKRGARLTIYLTVPLTILECILRDQATMASLIGHVASDLIKVGISSLISAMAGLVVGSLVTVAAAPIFAVIAAGVFTGIVLETIDQQYGLTDKLVAVLEKYSDKMEQAAGRMLYDAERELMWRCLLPVGNGSPDNVVSYELTSFNNHCISLWCCDATCSAAQMDPASYFIRSSRRIIYVDVLLGIIPEVLPSYIPRVVVPGCSTGSFIWWCSDRRNNMGVINCTLYWSRLPILHKKKET
jgi:hypothetical protein